MQHQLAGQTNNLECKAVFAYLDQNKDGYVQLEEAKARMAEYGLSIPQIEQVFCALDTSGLGRISYSDFCKGYSTHWRAVEKAALNRYEKVRTIGRGSFGVVRLMRKKDNGAHVVLKKVDVTDSSKHR